MYSWIHQSQNRKNHQAGVQSVRLSPFSRRSKDFVKDRILNQYTKQLIIGYWSLTAVLFVIGLLMLVFATPAESAFGPVQRIFYIHLPAAICMFVAAFSLFVASAGFLWTRSMKWDDLADTSGKVTVLLCSIVLFTGMVWGKSEWGTWWTWSPRLTLSLILWILYVVYLIIRPSVHTPTRRANICAIYGLAAFIDVPIVYASVKLMPDIHPSSVQLEPAMQLTLLVWSAAVPLMMIGLIAAGYSLNRKRRALGSQSEIIKSPGETT